MAELKLPVSEEQIRALKVGDAVELSGRIITGRDAAHTWLMKDFRDDVAPFMKDTVIYHCGPVVAGLEDKNYEFVAAGPTTSIREEPYQADVIGRYGLRGVIGKGGMGPKTLKGLADHGAVYFHAIGGAAQVLADAIPKVERVFMLEEFGVPEAMWVIQLDKFPVVVSMDSHGASLHDTIEEHSKQVFSRLVG